MKVSPRTKEEVKLMRRSGFMAAKALKKVIEAAKPGVNLIKLDLLAEDEIARLGGKSSFKTVSGYKWTTCLTLNHEVVHGIPRDIVLQEGDILGIDLGALYKGWHSDTAWSVVVGGGKLEFLEKGEQSLWNAIDQAVEGKRIGDISSAIQETIEGAGYSVVRALVGHGVGRQLHEKPEIPGVGKKGVGMILESGMTLAIESIYTAGLPEVALEGDGWTISSKDGSLAGLFEMTVVVGKNKAEVLTDWRKI